MSHDQRKGLLPGADLLIAINLALADLSRRIAQSQARQGVDERTAAHHATNQAGALMAWAFFIAPVMGLFTLGALGSPPGMVIIAPVDIIGLVILIRIHTAIIRPANQRLIYAIPTRTLVVVGGLYVCGLFLLMFINLMRS